MNTRFTKDIYTHFFIRLPEGVSFEEGALIEPLSVGIHASRRGEIKLGDRVFVFGAGPVGLLTAAAAKAAGASHVTIADISEARLKFAKSYIADEIVLLTNRAQPGQDSNEFARQEAANLLETNKNIQPCQVVFDCTGVESCVQMSVYVSVKKIVYCCDINRISTCSSQRTMVKLSWSVWVLLSNRFLLLISLLERLMLEVS
jgi:threonine dehydrogenase-like Zn-dependent dehydrogenase